MITASAVAHKPMANPSSRLGHAPSTICRKISWFRWSVPRGWAGDGGCIGGIV